VRDLIGAYAHGAMSAVELLVWGAVIHLVVDWLLQNEWMAENKKSLRHPAAYVHAGLHGAGLAIVFPPLAALALAVLHMLIDTRKPLEWWARVFGQTADGSLTVQLFIWRDQALHIGTIAIVALIVGG
jgi:hypothetical protein